jgi:hypothetical protein
MCSPEGWAGATIGMLQAGAENSAARTEWHWRKQMEDMGEKSALEAMRTQYEQSATRQMQEQMSRGQEMAMIAKKAAAVKAAATVRASKGGVAGASVNALQQQFERDALESMGVRKQEADWANTMAAQQREAIQQQAQSRIEAVQAGPEPSSAGRFMNTLSSMVTGAIQGHQMSSGIEAATPSPVSGATPMSSIADARAVGALPPITFSTPFGSIPQNWLQAPLESLHRSALNPTVSSLRNNVVKRLGSFTKDTAGVTSIFPSVNLGTPSLSIGQVPRTVLEPKPLDFTLENTVPPIGFGSQASPSMNPSGYEFDIPIRPLGLLGPTYSPSPRYSFGFPFEPHNSWRSLTIGGNY